MWDLVVVGAGPAGATAALAALAADPHARVLLLDRAGFPRDKACGDGIPPHALDVLARLGVDPLDGEPPVRDLRLGFRTGLQVAAPMRRPAYVVPRLDFDARLVRVAVARGAVLRRHRVRAVTALPDRVVLDGLEARSVVGADGANGVTRAAAGVRPPRAGHVAVAIRGYRPVAPPRRAADVGGPAARPGEQVIVFAAEGWPAYAWSFPLGDGTANVGYGEVRRPGRSLTRADLLGRLEDLLPGSTEGATGWRAHHLPLSSDRPRQPDGRVLLAGDALSLVNPMTGEGIYYAVLSGALAGRAVIAADGAPPGVRYRRSLRRALGVHLAHTTVAASLARHRRVVEAAVGAARADRRVFDDLVELGLGRGLLTPRVLAGLGRHLPPARRVARAGRT